jgi:hypothetical protein
MSGGFRIGFIHWFVTGGRGRASSIEMFDRFQVTTRFGLFDRLLMRNISGCRSVFLLSGIRQDHIGSWIAIGSVVRVAACFPDTFQKFADFFFRKTTRSFLLEFEIRT